MNVFNLNGIGDPGERKRLRKQAEREAGNVGIRKLFAVLIVSILAVVAIKELGWASRLSPKTASSKSFYEMVISLFFVAAGFYTAHYWRRSDLKQPLVQILRSARRCTSCGYQLVDAPEGKCPECGALRELS